MKPSGPPNRKVRMGLHGGDISDESHIRPIFRSTSPLRKPAAVLGVFWLVVVFPFYATWEMRDDFMRALRELLSAFRGELRS